MNIRKNLIANLMGQGWSAILNLAAVPIYIALLGVESFGLIGFAAVLLVLASLLDGGLATTLNRAMVMHKAGRADLRETSDLLRSSESLIGGAAVALGLLGLTMAPLVANWFLEPESLSSQTVANCVAIICVVSLLRVIEAVYRGALLGLDRAVLVNVLSVFSASLRVLGPVPLIWYAAGDVMTYFWVQLVVSVLSLLTFAAATHVVLEGSVFGRGRVSVGAMRGSIKFAGTAFAIAALSAVANQLDKLFVARFASLDELGYYSAAAVVAAGIYQLVLPVFHSFYPKLSYLHASGGPGDFDRLFMRFVLVVSFVASVPIAVIMLNTNDVLFAWTGNEEVAARAGTVLAWLCLGSLCNGLFHAPLGALLASGRQTIAAVTSGVLVSALVPLLYVGWSLAGSAGIAATWGMSLAAWYLATLLRTLLFIGSTKVRWSGLVFSIAPFAVSLLVTFALRELLGILPQAQVSRALAVSAIAAVVGGATAISVWQLDRSMTPLPRATV